MEFQFLENQAAAKIKVIGVGGAGNNAINNMIASGLAGVGFVAANTDLQDSNIRRPWSSCNWERKRTKGLGCGADPWSAAKRPWRCGKNP
jgi:cell division protein FtsZ